MPREKTATIIPFTPKRARKKPKGKCETRMCRNDAIQGRRFCAKCRSKQFKAAHPLKYFFNLARCHAVRRGFEFTLPFPEYERLAIAANWVLENRGRDAMCLSLDRIDSSKGYVSGNVRVCTISENASKGDSDVSWIRKYGGYFAAPMPDDETEAEQLAFAGGENPF